MAGVLSEAQATRFFRVLSGRVGSALVPNVVYYWLLDRLTPNNGWRPLGYRWRDWSFDRDRTHS